MQENCSNNCATTETKDSNLIFDHKTHSLICLEIRNQIKINKHLLVYGLIFFWLIINILIRFFY
jgi:hypothetical protein